LKKAQTGKSAEIETKPFYVGRFTLQYSRNKMLKQTDKKETK